MAEADPKAIASEVILCSYCMNPINPAAKKCPTCLEFTASGKPEVPQPANWVEIVKALLECFGKLGLPLAIIVFVVLFRADLGRLFARAQKAQFGENVITFDVPKVFQEPLDLRPLALFWLMQAARHGEGQRYNYDSLKEDDFSALAELQRKGLATFGVEERNTKDERDARTFGRKEMKIVASAKGGEFLKAIGLEISAPATNSQGT
jgi:hypothetical protein